MDEESKSFIELLNNKRYEVVEDRNELLNVLDSLSSIFERYYGKDKAFVKQIDEQQKYARILLQVGKDNYPLCSQCNIKAIADKTRALIDSAIEEVQAIGIPNQVKGIAPKGSKSNGGIKIVNNLTQSQTQSQEQNVVVNILLEAIKDDLTGKQRKELLAIAKEASTPEEAHKGILEKLKSFGADVSASIVANILTNPQVWSVIDTIV